MLKVGDIIKKEVSDRVVSNYDVVVCGGGTAGCTAALSTRDNLMPREIDIKLLQKH